MSCVSKILKLSEGICDNVIKCDKKIKIQLSVFPSLDVMDVIITKYDIEITKYDLFLFSWPQDYVGE